MRTRRVLRISGPVPWKLKAPFFTALGSSWDGEIRKAIHAAQAEYFGQVDERAARRWLEQD